jgi:hypothetical protein
MIDFGRERGIVDGRYTTTVLMESEEEALLIMDL